MVEWLLVPKITSFTETTLEFFLRIHRMWWIVLACILLLLLAAELWAWCWHSMVAHGSRSTSVSTTHKKHHQDQDDMAHNDFSWIVVLLIFFALCLFVVYCIGVMLIPTSTPFWGALVISLWITAFLLFLLQYYIHHTYHNLSSRWHNYEWFQHMTLDHYLHHMDESCNYGITNHIIDDWFGTYR